MRSTALCKRISEDMAEIAEQQHKPLTINTHRLDVVDPWD